MAAIWRSLGETSYATDKETKRDGLPNLEELLWQNATLRNSFQSEKSAGSNLTDDSERKTSTDYCPSTPSQCGSPSIEQFYFGMDNESPTLAIGTPFGKSANGVLEHEQVNTKSPASARPELLASLTSFLDSQHDHYAAVMNAVEMEQFDEYEDDVYNSDFEDYEEDFSDDDFEYGTIEIATIISFSRPIAKPKLVDISPICVARSPSITESTSRYSNSSTVSKLYSQYSWTGDNSSDVSDHVEEISEDEYHDSAETSDTLDEKSCRSSNWPFSSASPNMEGLDSAISSSSPPFDEFLTSSPALSLRFSMETRQQQDASTSEGQRSSGPPPMNAAVQIPSRSSSKLHTKMAKQSSNKSPGLRRSGGAYSLFPLRNR